jgi:hypothetical protein
LEDYGSPGQPVSCSITEYTDFDTVEVWGSSPHVPTISFLAVGTYPIPSPTLFHSAFRSAIALIPQPEVYSGTVPEPPAFWNPLHDFVDVEKGILALGGELHADANAALLARGSEQKDLWGINL